MSRFVVLISLLTGGVLLFGGLIVPDLHAHTWGEELSIFYFKAPVALPGRVLPAGTYLFKLAQNNNEGNVVEVKNPQETKLYGVFLVKPEYRIRVPKRSGLIFAQGATGSPPAIQAWCYQESNYFNDFLYAK